MLCGCAMAFQFLHFICRWKTDISERNARKIMEEVRHAIGKLPFISKYSKGKSVKKSV
jgi:hypothetical protein